MDNKAELERIKAALEPGGRQKAAPQPV